jgi:hypothetical protein
MDLHENNKIILHNYNNLYKHYEKFWYKLFHNDAYVYYKNAITFYQNTQNNKYHNFYSGLINKRLYIGKCIVASKKTLQTFSNNTTSDELCQLTIDTINILDNVFLNCNKLPYSLYVYRGLWNVNINSYLLKLKQGQYFRSNEFLSTTINPYYVANFYDMYMINDSDNNNILFEIQLPKNSKGYFINKPFDTNVKIPFNEFEFVLPRDCIFKVIKKYKVKNWNIYTIQLCYQLPPKLRQINNIENDKNVEILFSKQKLKEFKKFKLSDKKNKVANYVSLYSTLNYFFDYLNKLSKKNKPLNEPKIDKNNTILIKPRKFWILVTPILYTYNSTNYNKNYISLEKNKDKLKLYDKLNIVIKKNWPFHIPEYINYTMQYNKTKQKYYTIDKSKSLSYLLEIKNTKKRNISVISHGNHLYYTFNNPNIFDIKIIKKDKIIICDDFYYTKVYAQLL